MSTTSVRHLSADWFTESDTVTTSAKEITKPSDLKELRTVMISAAKANTANIYFGDANDVSTTNAGGELGPGDVAVLPLDLTRDDQKLFIIAASGTQRYYISDFTGGDNC